MRFFVWIFLEMHRQIQNVSKYFRLGPLLRSTFESQPFYIHTRLTIEGCVCTFTKKISNGSIRNFRSSNFRRIRPPLFIMQHIFVSTSHEANNRRQYNPSDNVKRRSTKAVCAQMFRRKHLRSISKGTRSHSL